jgi:hypothetical protein
VGKLVAAFIFFLGASALAIHESKPPPPPREDPIAPVAPEKIDHTPPSRAVRDEVPPWVKYATPPKPTTVVHIEPPPPPIERRVVITESEISVDIPDAIDRCPDQPNDRDDNDGCPEPERDRVILFE